MSLKGKRVFIRKNGNEKGGSLYKWAPFNNDIKSKPKKSQAFFCSTPLGTQGDDRISTYSYVIVVINGNATRSAYVQCDYVQ